MAIDHAAGLFTVDIVVAAQANDLLRRVPSAGAFPEDLCAVYAPAQHAPGARHMVKADAAADETDHLVAPTDPRA